MKKQCYLNTFLVLSILMFPSVSSSEVFPAPYKFFALDYHKGNLVGREGVEADISTLLMRIGARMSNHLGMEMRMGWPGGDDTVYLAEARNIFIATPGDYRVNTGFLLGGYVKLYPWHTYFDPYMLGGFTIGSVDYDGVGTFMPTFEDQMSGISYGAGAELEIWKGKLVVEHISYMKSDKWNLDGITLSWIFSL